MPLTVRTNPIPSGAVASGTSGWLISGTGFCAAAHPVKATLAAIVVAMKKVRRRGLMVPPS